MTRPGLHPCPVAAAALAALLAAAPVPAQQDDERTEAQTPVADPLAPMDELVVITKKPGDPVDTEARYEAQLRQRLMKELEDLERLEEQQAWRAEVSPPGDSDARIRWGYDPGQELEMRRRTDFDTLPTEREKPSTLFRARF